MPPAFAPARAVRAPVAPPRAARAAPARCAAHAPGRARVPRRRFAALLSAAAAAAVVRRVAAAAPPPVALANEEANAVFGYAFRVPRAGWTRSTAAISAARTVVVYVCDEDGDSNVNVVSTPVPSDFQKLTSFGTLDNVLETLVPRGRKDIEGEVISTSMDAKNNAYLIEYAITAGGVRRRLLTVFSLQPGRYINALTAQAREDNWRAREAVFRAILGSFTLQELD